MCDVSNNLQWKAPIRWNGIRRSGRLSLYDHVLVPMSTQSFKLIQSLAADSQYVFNMFIKAKRIWQVNSKKFNALQN